jgi:hypothetical protein
MRALFLVPILLLAGCADQKTELVPSYKVTQGDRVWHSCKIRYFDTGVNIWSNGTVNDDDFITVQGNLLIERDSSVVCPAGVTIVY